MGKPWFWARHAMTTTYQKNLWRLALGGTFAAMAAAAGCSANEFPASSATDRDRGQAGAAAGGTAGGGDGGGGETPGATDDPVSCVELEQGPCPAEHDAALTQGAGLVPAPRCHFKLELNPEGIATERALEALALELDTVALPDVLTENSPAMVTVPLTEPELARIDGLVAAMQWADRDSWDRSWMPQGISGSADAAASGRIGGRNYLAVSWYHKPEDDPATNTNYGSRISLIDVTDVDSGVVRYEHALLVRPAEMDDGPNPCLSTWAASHGLGSGSLSPTRPTAFVYSTRRAFSESIRSSPGSVEMPRPGHLPPTATRWPCRKSACTRSPRRAVGIASHSFLPT